MAFDHVSKMNKVIFGTAMCKAAGKKMNDYTRLSTTSAYLEELSADTGIPVTELYTLAALLLFNFAVLRTPNEHHKRARDTVKQSH